MFCFRRNQLICLLSATTAMLPGLACSAVFEANNLTINPDGSEGQLCSGTFRVSEGFELCRRKADGALGTFEVFLNDLTVNEAGELVFADVVIGVAEITQTFPGLGTLPDGQELTFNSLYWVLKDNRGSVLALRNIEALPEIAPLLANGDAVVTAAVDFLNSAVDAYFREANELIAAENDIVYGIDHFLDCVGTPPDERDPICATLYDLDGNGTLNNADYYELVRIVEGEDAADMIVSLDLDLSLYYLCAAAGFNDSDEEEITQECKVLDLNNSATVDETDLRLHFDFGEELGNQDLFDPVANAGSARAVPSSATVVLDGSQSFDLETPFGQLDFSWEQVFGAVEVELQTSDEAVAGFLAPEVEEPMLLQFRLTVADNAGREGTDIADITVLPEGPVADAGDDNFATTGQSVMLDASRSAGQNISLQWSQTAGTAVSLSSSTTTFPTFIAPQVVSPTVLTFELTVTDENSQSDTDSVDVTISPAAASGPEADAGPDDDADELTTVQLDGSGSTGDDLIYQWTIIEAAETLLTTADLSSTVIAAPFFIAPNVAVPTTLIFQLTVTDVNDDSDTDQVAITILPLPAAE